MPWLYSWSSRILSRALLYNELVSPLQDYLGNSMPELTDSQIQAILVNLDAELNDILLTAILYGIYTGVVAVALWAVASRNNCQNHRQRHFLVVIILLLYFLAAFNLYRAWVLSVSYFASPKRKYLWEAVKFSPDISTAVSMTGEVFAILSTVLADATLIWRCWIIWGRSWRIVFIPIVCTTLATASRGIVAYYNTFGSNVPPQALFLENIVSWSLLYSSLVLATLLWCTILIIYRIWRVGAAAGRMHVYQRVIEMLVESASLYSAVIVALLVFEARNEFTGIYVQDFAIAMRGIMPTVLIGRVAAGHARPDDSWSESTTGSSLRFRDHSGSQNDTQMSVRSGWDTSSRAIEEGLEDSTEVQVERVAPTVSTHDFSTPVVGTSNSVDYSVV